MHKTSLKTFALRGAELGVVEKMELALIWSADNPDEDHPEWIGSQLVSCIEGDWAEKPCVREGGRDRWTRQY